MSLSLAHFPLVLPLCSCYYNKSTFLTQRTEGEARCPGFVICKLSGEGSRFLAGGSKWQEAHGCGTSAPTQGIRWACDLGAARATEESVARSLPGPVGLLVTYTSPSQPLL